LFQLKTCVLGFKHLETLYAHDEHFRELYEGCKQKQREDYLLKNGYLFSGTRLCVLWCGTRELLIREVYKGALVGQYRENKMTSMLKEHYFWPGTS